jgi:hypothetical protein
VPRCIPQIVWSQNNTQGKVGRKLHVRVMLGSIRYLNTVWVCLPINPIQFESSLQLLARYCPVVRSSVPFKTRHVPRWQSIDYTADQSSAMPARVARVSGVHVIHGILSGIDVVYLNLSFVPCRMSKHMVLE